MRAERRRGFDGSGGAGAPGDWGSADEFFCKYRDVAEERVRAHAGDVARTIGAKSNRSGCIAEVPGASRGNQRSGGKAQTHWSRVYRGVRGRGAKAAAGGSAWGDWIPGARDVVSRCNRIGVGKGAVRDDKDASQRGWIAGPDALCVDRAVARFVQRRGAKGREKAGIAR